MTKKNPNAKRGRRVGSSALAKRADLLLANKSADGEKDHYRDGSGDLGQEQRLTRGSFLGIVHQGRDAAREGHGDGAEGREHPAGELELPRLNVRRIFAEIAGSQPVDLVLAYLLVPCFFRVTNRKLLAIGSPISVKHRDPAPLAYHQLLKIIALLAETFNLSSIALVFLTATHKHALFFDYLTCFADRF